MTDRSELAAQPSLPSRATRAISRRSKASSRGFITGGPPAAGGRRRIIQFESKLEQRVAFLLMTRTDLTDLWDQPPAITYQAPDGRARRHTFDYLATFVYGRRWAVVVKPQERAARQKFRRELEAIRTGLRKDYADELRLITDVDFSRAEALNAERLHRFRGSLSPEVLAQAYVRFGEASYPTTVGDLVRHLDMTGLGFQAIVIGIYDGRLIADTRSEIDERTPIDLPSSREGVA